MTQLSTDAKGMVILMVVFIIGIGLFALQLHSYDEERRASYAQMDARKAGAR